MKKTNLSWLVAVTLLMAACSKDDTVNDAVFPATEEALVKGPITPQQINAQIDQSLQETTTAKMQK